MNMLSMFSIITVLLSLVFLAGLLLLTIRTKSVGIGIILTAILIETVLNSVILPLLFSLFIDDNNITFNNFELINPIVIMNFITSSVTWFSLIASSVGVLLIYNEWKNGKFQPPQSENRYQLHN